MVDVTQLRPGDKVRIVDQWTEPHRENNDGLMDKYLSAVMTVREVVHSTAYMEEDVQDCGRVYGWCWSAEMIAEIVLREEEREYEISESDFDALFL